MRGVRCEGGKVVKGMGKVISTHVEYGEALKMNLLSEKLFATFAGGSSSVEPLSDHSLFLCSRRVRKDSVLRR